MYAVTQPENSKAIEALLKANPDLSIRDNQGKTALGVAKEEGWASSASKLEKAGARE